MGVEIKLRFTRVKHGQRTTENKSKNYFLQVLLILILSLVFSVWEGNVSKVGFLVTTLIGR